MTGHKNKTKTKIQNKTKQNKAKLWDRQTAEYYSAIREC